MTIYTILSASTRPTSQSSKVARFIIRQIQALEPDATTHIVDLSEVNLKQWNEDFWEDGPSPCPEWNRLAPQLAASNAFIIVCPEWNGMAPPALMNVFLLAGTELAHKPALIVTVSATAGGAYPAAELRAFGHKNTHICYVPGNVIVRGARDVLNEDAAVDETDAEVRERLRYGLGVLAEYAKALNLVRASGALDLEAFPYGM